MAFLSIPELAKALAPELARHLVPLLVQELDHRQAERLDQMTDELGARMIKMAKEELLPPIRGSKWLVTMETRIRRDFDRGKKRSYHSISPTPQAFLSIPELAKALAPELARHLVHTFYRVFKGGIDHFRYSYSNHHNIFVLQPMRLILVSKCCILNKLSDGY